MMLQDNLGRVNMDPLYLADLDSCYIRSFEAKVVGIGDEIEGKYILLDRTAFYPIGGGQPNDKGRIDWEGGICEIHLVRKKGPIMHFITGDPPPLGSQVTGTIDWDIRYGNMMMHTAQHMVSNIIWKRYKAKTVGNQIHPDRSRIDFAPLSLSNEDVHSIEKEANRIIGEAHAVIIDFRERSFFLGSSDIERLDMDRVPKEISVLRTVSIGLNGVIDICPCAGTHVRNLSELGRLRITGIESKGKDRIRFEYVLTGKRGE